MNKDAGYFSRKQLFSNIVAKKRKSFLQPLFTPEEDYAYEAYIIDSLEKSLQTQLLQFREELDKSTELLKDDLKKSIIFEVRTVDEYREFTRASISEKLQSRVTLQFERNMKSLIGQLQLQIYQEVAKYRKEIDDLDSFSKSKVPSESLTKEIHS